MKFTKKSIADDKSKTELKIKWWKSKSKEKKLIKTSLTSKIPHRLIESSLGDTSNAKMKITPSSSFMTSGSGKQWTAVKYMIKNEPSNDSLTHSLSTGYLQKKDEEIKAHKSQICIDLTWQTTKGIKDEEKQ